MDKIFPSVGSFTNYRAITARYDTPNKRIWTDQANSLRCQFQSFARMNEVDFLVCGQAIISLKTELIEQSVDIILGVENHQVIDLLTDPNVSNRKI